MISIFNSFFNYALCVIGSGAVVCLGVYLGMIWRKKKDANNKE